MQRIPTGHKLANTPCNRTANISRPLHFLIRSHSSGMHALPPLRMGQGQGLGFSHCSEGSPSKNSASKRGHGYGTRDTLPPEKDLLLEIPYPLDRMTHACENIYIPESSLAIGNKRKWEGTHVLSRSDGAPDPVSSKWERVQMFHQGLESSPVSWVGEGELGCIPFAPQYVVIQLRIRKRFESTKVKRMSNMNSNTYCTFISVVHN